MKIVNHASRPVAALVRRVCTERGYETNFTIIVHPYKPRKYHKYVRGWADTDTNHIELFVPPTAEDADILATVEHEIDHLRGLDHVDMLPISTLRDRWT